VKKKISASGVILSFLCLLWIDLFPQAAAPAQSEFQKALEAGKKLYESGEHKEAIIRLFEAQNLAREKRDLAEACFHISLCYYALGESENSLAYLRKAFEADPEKNIDERLFPPRFVGLFYQTKRDVLKAAPAKPEAKVEEKKIEAEKKAEPGKKEELKGEAAKKVEPPKIEKKKEPDKKIEKKPEEQKPPAAAGRGKQEIPARKKSKFPWLIAGGVAVAGGVVAILLMKKETTATPAVSTTGNIAITSAPTGAKVFLDGTDTGQTTNCTLTNIAVGPHVLKLVLDNYGKWEGNIQVLGGQTANVTATLAGYAYEFVTKWGNLGTGDGQFNYPRGIAVNGLGNVFVTDDENCRVQIFSSIGGFLSKWGSGGSGAGQFQTPGGIATDSTGFIYITEWDNHRVQKFTSGGGYVSRWGSIGGGSGQFNSPRGIAINAAGNVFVADLNNHRVEKFSLEGSFLVQWGQQGIANSQFNFPEGIAVSNSGFVFVADTSNHRVQKFDLFGGYLDQWGSSGTGIGKFNTPMGIAVDDFGYVFVADTNNSRIQKFTSTGGFLTQWGSPGSGDGQFDNPGALAVDSSGYVYVVDTRNHRVQKFRMKTESPLPAKITYTLLYADSFGPDSAYRPGFFSDPRTMLPFGFSGAPDIFNIRQAPPVGFFRTPGSRDGFFRMPGMPGDQIISPRGVYGLPDVSIQFEEIPQKTTSAAVPGSSVPKKTKKD